MISNVKISSNLETSISHHGLIKLVVKDALLNTRWSWVSLIEGIPEEQDRDEDIIDASYVEVVTDAVDAAKVAKASEITLRKESKGKKQL